MYIPVVFDFFLSFSTIFKVFVIKRKSMEVKI